MGRECKISPRRHGQHRMGGLHGLTGFAAARIAVGCPGSGAIRPGVHCRSPPAPTRRRESSPAPQSRPRANPLRVPEPGAPPSLAPLRIARATSMLPRSPRGAARRHHRRLGQPADAQPASAGATVGPHARDPVSTRLGSDLRPAPAEPCRRDRPARDGRPPITEFGHRCRVMLDVNPAAAADGEFSALRRRHAVPTDSCLPPVAPRTRQAHGTKPRKPRDSCSCDSWASPDC